MNFLRFIFGIPGAAIITGLLFVFMAMTIKSEGPAFSERPVKVGPVVPQIEPSAPRTPTRQRPEPLKPPTPPDVAPSERSSRPDDFDFGADPVTPDPGEPVSGARPPIASVRIAPQYPQACQSRAAQGVVLVQFDVAPDGSVVNARIIESADRCFNKTVLRTVAKWKYPPAQRNGRAVMRRGVVERFNFQLTE